MTAPGGGTVIPKSIVRCALLLLLLVPTSVVDAQLPGGGATGGDDAVGGATIFEIQKGIGYLREGEMGRARDHFRGLSRRSPENPMPWYYLALAHAGLEDGSATIEALREAAAQGWKDPEKFTEDAGLTPLRESDAGFARALDTLVESFRARREEGVVPAVDGTFEWTDAEGDTASLSEGVPHLVLFVRAEDAADITPLWTVAALAEGAEEAWRPVVLVECRGKTETERLEKLAEFRDMWSIELPLGLATEEQRRMLRPWRTWPTLARVDADGRIRRVVEGFPADLEERYAACAAPTPEPEGDGDPHAPPKDPAKTPAKDPAKGSDGEPEG